MRYLDEIVEPTIRDFENNPTSVRHAFLACVAVFHTVDYLARSGDELPATLRGKLRKDSSDFDLVDDVAHAFKHVFVGKREEPRLKASEVISRPPGVFDAAVFDLSVFDDSIGGVTLDKERGIDLLKTVRRAVEFLRGALEGK